jgi:hypothetical protein
MQRPERPSKPKHVPAWPLLVVVAFMVAIIVSGIVASNHARGEKLTIVTSTLPPKHPAKITTTTTGHQTTSTAPTTEAAQTGASTSGSSACSAANLLAAARASGQVPESIGPVQVDKFKCVSGYAIAHLQPQDPNQQDASADFQLQSGKTWKLLTLGAVDPAEDGVPGSIASQLTLQ